MKLKNLQQIVEGYECFLVEQAIPPGWWSDPDATPPDPSMLGLPFEGDWIFDNPMGGNPGWIWLDEQGTEWSIQYFNQGGYNEFPQLGFYPPTDHPLHPNNLPDYLYDIMYPSWVYPGLAPFPEVGDLIDQGLAPAWLNDLPDGYEAELSTWVAGEPVSIRVLGPNGDVIYDLPWHGSFAASALIDTIYQSYLGALDSDILGEGVDFANYLLLWLNSEYNPAVHGQLAWGFDVDGSNVDPNAIGGVPPIQLPDGSTWHPTDEPPDDGDGPDTDGPDTDGPDGDGPDGDGDGPKPKTPPKFGTSPGSDRPSGKIRILPKAIKSILTP